MLLELDSNKIDEIIRQLNEDLEKLKEKTYKIFKIY